MSPATVNLIRQAEGHERARRYDLARASYRDAAAAGTDDHSRAFAAHRFASALAFWGELEEARQELETSIRLDGSKPGAWHDLGVIAAKLGDFVNSEVALRKARGLAPADARPRIALAALLVRSRRFTEARSEYVALLDLEIRGKTREAIGRALELIDAER